MKALTNIQLLTSTGIRTDLAVVFDTRIVDILPATGLQPGVTTINGDGLYLAPGFIELHIHGCAGYDTMDDDPAALPIIAKNLVKTGVTSFLATTMTMEPEKIRRALKRIADYQSQPQTAKLLGAHLEGPFLSQQYKGAQDGRYLAVPDFSLIAPYREIIRLITLAPEQPDSLAFIQHCRNQDIIVSIGHSDASFEEALAAIAAGANHITHTFNAMNPLHHRKPGIITAAMLDDTVSCELIADNIHVHPAIQQLLLKVKGIAGIVLVTDAMRACLLQDGLYDLGGLPVMVQNGQARHSDGRLAGSVLTLNQAIKNFSQNTGLPLWEAVKAATENPARRLGLTGKGAIQPGNEADLVLLDSEFNVCQTFINGDLAYRRS